MAASHDLDPFISLLKRDGTLVLVGAPEHPHPSPTVFNLLFARRSLGGLAASAASPRRRRCSTTAPRRTSSRDIEMIPMQKINEAYERMIKGDVKYRFVIDMKSL